MLSLVDEEVESPIFNLFKAILGNGVEPSESSDNDLSRCAFVIFHDSPIYIDLLAYIILST